MVRPQDWGDQKPSDLDDTPPVSPTVERTEHSYSIDPPRPESQPTDRTKDFSPDPNIANIPEQPRRVYTGIVVKHVNSKDDFPRKYWILREDGATGYARLLKQDLYTDILIGNEVNIVQAPEEDGWVITGNSRPFELPQMMLELVTTTFASETTLIPLTIKEAYPIDDTFGVDTFETIKLLAPGVIEVTKDAVFDIHYCVDVENAFPDVPIYDLGIAVTCPDNYLTQQSEEEPCVKLPLIEFNKQNGFDLRTDESKCSAFISLKSDCQDSILNQQGAYPGEDAFWTQSPYIGGHLTIGTKTDGWLRWGSKNGSAIKGRGSLKTMLPPAPPTTSCDFLVADGKGEDCVSLGWRQPGGTGVIQTLEVLEWQYQTKTVTVTVSDASGGYCYCDVEAEVEVPVPIFKTCSYTVSHGLVIDDTCDHIEETTCDNAIQCYQPRACISDPCDYLDDSRGE